MVKKHVGTAEEVRSSSKALTEDHLRAITGVVLALELSPWLTTEQAWEELAEKAVRPIAFGVAEAWGFEHGTPHCLLCATGRPDDTKLAGERDERVVRKDFLPPWRLRRRWSRVRRNHHRRDNKQHKCPDANLAEKRLSVKQTLLNR